ncbi:MAG: DNA topoisomerase I [Candidatus Micrarchaeota archaeon]
MDIELVVAEKPKVAEKIAYAIGGKSVKKKSLGKVSYFETEINGKLVVIAPAVGHVYTLAEKKKSSGYPIFDIEWKPTYDVSKSSAFTKPYLNVLESVGKKAKSFVAACDFDIEGSLIGYNIYKYAVGGKKPARRMKFSTLTDNELKEAYENSIELDYNNAYAGETRHILDWYYGINLSRALMGAIRKVNRYRVMSIGRVQGPALYLLASLEKEIKAFVPSPYWEITLLAKGCEFHHSEGRFVEEAIAKQKYENTTKEGTVEKVEKKAFTVAPQPNFDLTSLQVEVYRLFGITPKKTLEIAQSLYENSLISYPRTSSQQISDKLKPFEIVKKISGIKGYEELAKKLIKNDWNKPLQGKKEDPAHPAIHPTGQKGEMNEYDAKVYDLIVRRFLASFAPPAKKERTGVKINSNGELYSASGAVTKEKGWIEFYGPHYKAEDNELPEFKEKEKVTLEDKKNTRKETKPPNRYSEASIVSELESRHLGTKATRAVVIETLFDRGYAEGKSIKVSDFGLEVCEILRKYAPEILDEYLTRHIEEDMEKIQEGKADKEKILIEARTILTNTLTKWKTNEEAIGNELVSALKITQDKETTVGTCDKCGNSLRIIRMKAGKQFIGCRGYPNCRNAYPLPGGAFVTVSTKLCKDCNKPTVDIKRFKSRFSMCIDPKCPSKASWGVKSKTETKIEAKTDVVKSEETKTLETKVDQKEK